MLVFPLVFASLSFKPLKQWITFSRLVRVLLLLNLVFIIGFYLYVLLSSNLQSNEARVITLLLAGSINTFSLSLSVPLPDSDRHDPLHVPL